MKSLYLITDYQQRFSTKFTARPYRSGLNKALIKKEFHNLGFEADFINAAEVHQLKDNLEGKIFIYTSAEDRGGNYKSFIEDVVLALEYKGAVVIPGYVFLRAHNNKVLIELLRGRWSHDTEGTIESKCFGTYEELLNNRDTGKYPVVVKQPEGFKSRGVFLAQDRKSLLRLARHISSTISRKNHLKDLLRIYKHKGFIPESQHRKKFVVQQFIPGLTNDWKVLVYGDKYYPLFRKTRKNDFRASGSGLLSYCREVPDGLLNTVERLVHDFNVPQISVDIAFDGQKFYIFELQFIYFGTYTIEHSEFYFHKENSVWKIVEGKSVVEEEYARSMAAFINNNFRAL